MSLDQYPQCPERYLSAPSAAELEMYADFGIDPPTQVLLRPHQVDGYDPSVQENVRVFCGLRDITDPIARVATRQVLETPGSMEADRPRIIYKLPYEMTDGLLYRTDFGKKVAPDSSEERTDETEKPATQESKDALVQEYLRNSDHPSEYRAVYEAHKAHGTEDDFIGLCNYRIRESRKHVDGRLNVFTGRFSEYVVTKPNIDDAATGLPEVLMMPVGAYGEAFARKLLLATRTTMESMNNSAKVDAEAAQAAAQNKKLLAEFTVRGAHEYEATGDVSQDTVKATLLEGALSVMQVLAWLTAEKVPGYENPDELFNDIIDQGLVEKLTRKLTMGTIGPTAVMGIYPEHALTVVDGKLDLSEDLLAILAERKAATIPPILDDLIARYDHEKWSGGDIKDEIYQAGTGHTTGIMCPAAGKDGGVRQSAEALKAVYAQLD